MGKYKYTIYDTYPSKIYKEGEFWAWSYRHAYTKIIKLAGNKFFEICPK